jgi:succinyl-diaminopimelate desuccinylase
MKEIKETVSTLKEEIIKSLQACIRIKSISGDEEGTLKVLEFFLNLGQSMGFKSANVNNLGGIIEFGEGERTLGIIVHLDTVPEGTGWQYPPFEGRIEDNKIYGRGAIDDKGPAISVLYALKTIQDTGIKPDCKIQIIIGIDEETVWNTTPKLLKKIREPDFAFVPDSNFPIVIAEKGLVWIEITKDFLQINPNTETTKSQTNLDKNNQKKQKPSIIIKKILGGSESLNIVPDYCAATLKMTEDKLQTVEKKLQRFLQQEKFANIEIEKNDSEIKLLSHGKSAHAFNCDEGRNAISQLILFLNQLDIAEEQKTFLETYTSKIGMEYFGESLGLASEDELTGKLTVSPGYIHLDEKSANLKVDIRFPASEQLTVLKGKVDSAFQPFQGNLKIIDSLESLSFSEDDPNIQKLLQVYRDYNGDREAQPLGIGGTTFAKAFNNAVGFGPTFPGMAKSEHQPDEFMEIDHLMKCTEIYALAIKKLIAN